MTEQRNDERKKVLKGARISFHGGHSTIDCLVRNLSDGGAKVMVESTVGIPDEIVLAFNDGPSRPCRIVRRKINELGLQFVD